MTKEQELNDLFSMFHDFEITDVTYSKMTLNLTIKIPWGQLWNSLDFKINLELNGCDFIKCSYAELLKTKENLTKDWGQREYIDKTTEDDKVISTLGLEIQSHKLYNSKEFVFVCNSAKDFAGGQLTFSANDFRIFQIDGQEITLNQMKKWYADWWESIEAMWKDNEENRNNSSL